MHASSSRLLWSLCVLAVLGTAVPAVRAHAVVVTATPAANTTVDGAQVPIDLEFNSRIDLGRSRLAVIDDRQRTRDLTIDPTAPPNRIRSVATDRAPGTQLLEWYVLSADGHITRGRLKFKVRVRP